MSSSGGWHAVGEVPWPHGCAYCGGTHEAAQPAPPPLDVERLMEAMHEVYTYEDRDSMVPSRVFLDDVETFWTPFATQVAAEYIALRAALAEPPSCPYCAENLPLDATGWHIRDITDPDDLEGIQRIPCALNGGRP